MVEAADVDPDVERATFERTWVDTGSRFAAPPIDPALTAWVAERNEVITRDIIAPLIRQETWWPDGPGLPPAELRTDPYAAPAFVYEDFAAVNDPHRLADDYSDIPDGYHIHDDLDWGEQLVPNSAGCHLITDSMGSATSASDAPASTQPAPGSDVSRPSGQSSVGGLISMSRANAATVNPPPTTTSSTGARAGGMRRPTFSSSARLAGPATSGLRSIRRRRLRRAGRSGVGRRIRRVAGMPGLSAAAAPERWAERQDWAEVFGLMPSPMSDGSFPLTASLMWNPGPDR